MKGFRLSRRRPSIVPKQARILVILLFFVMGLQCISFLSINLLGIPNAPMPWSFITILSYGFILPVVIAFLVTVTLVYGIYLWLLGGVERTIANYALLFFIAFILANELAVYAYHLWEGVDITPYPWDSYRLLMTLSHNSVAFKHFVLCLLGSGVGMALLFLVTFFPVRSRAEKIFGQAHFANAFEIHQAGLYAGEGIVLGRAYGKTLRLSGFESVLVVAPTGGGKTTAIAVPNLLEWQGSGVFNDLKGELYRLTAKHRQTILKNECYLWAPADTTKNTACYNPFFYVSPNPDLRIRDLQLIAEILIPATKLGDGFWYQSSREVFLTLSLYLFETKGMATLSEIHDLSKQENFFEWLEKEVAAHEDEFSKYLKQNVYAILGADDKTQRNILKDFHSRIGLFNDPIVGYATHKNDFDFRELRRKKISIYIHIPDSDKERLSPILTLFWAQLVNVMASIEPQVDEPYGVLALMDEFGNMARINKLKEGMSFLRSYHVRCIIIVQYLSQISSIYGRDDAKGFLNSKVKITFALNDMDDAQFFSKALGTKTVKVSSSSVNTGHGDKPGSRSENFSYQSRVLISPDELMQLSDKKEIILIEAKSPIKADKCYWFNNPRYQQLVNKAKEAARENAQ